MSNFFSFSKNSRGYAVLRANCIIGHTRLVTNGSNQIHANNQPIMSHDMVAVHNGIVTNVDGLWRENADLERKTQLDTEVLLALIRKNLLIYNDIVRSIQSTYQVMEGAASLAFVFKDFDIAVLCTNVGSLYIVCSPDSSFYIFASERYILKTLLSTNRHLRRYRQVQIQQICANTGVMINLRSMEKTNFSLIFQKTQEDFQSSDLTSVNRNRVITDISSTNEHNNNLEHIPGDGPYILPNGFIDQYPMNNDKIAKLRRCKRCILPETMPFIEYDEEGICNYCRNHRPLKQLGQEALLEELSPYRKNTGEPDCLITFSGGRDSSYGLHTLKKVFGMTPVTYTYDWGMITDLGRRNQMRMCGKLGVENILVSADIAKKRRNIRSNVLAWLRKPDLGTIPLFMAGDKQYFYYANLVGKQTGCKITILCENMLETTFFKSGYCGIPPRLGSSHTYTLSLANKFKLATYYGMRYLENPAYFNQSIWDTLGAYASYYIVPHHIINIYEYIKWDEDLITKTLINEYDWEVANDTKSTWRIGDGTASFYNYIYYTLSGLTENDTFRSNQIREGMLTREDALRLVERDNQPRYESIQWYCDIVGIDFEYTLKVINAAPKLY